MEDSYKKRIKQNSNTYKKDMEEQKNKEKLDDARCKVISLIIFRFIVFFAAKDGEALHNQQKQNGADCGSDHELLTAKFRLKLKKVGKTTRQFWYDLNQIPYNYTVEVTNRFKGFDRIDRVPEELWTKVRDIVQEAMIKTIPKKRSAKRQNGCLRRSYKQLRKEEKQNSKKEKRKDKPI